MDVIASAIQGVIDTRKKTVQDTDVPRADIVPTSREQTQNHSDLMLHKELVGLFSIEAREWLAQLQTALKKLDANTEGAVRSELQAVIRNGIVNLACSASMVQLSDIEEMARALLPILRDIDKAGMEQTSEWLRPIHEGLDRIAMAVDRLAGTSDEAGTAAEGLDSIEPMRTEPVAEPDTVPVAPAPRPQEPVRVESSMPLLRALRELKRVRSRSVQPSRDVLEAVIERAEQEVGPCQDQIAAEAVERILSDLGRLD